MKNIYFCGYFLLVAAISAGCSRNCYSCSSNLNPDCKNPVKYSMQLKQCGIPALNETKHFAANLDQSLTKYFEVSVMSHDPLIPTNCLKQVTRVGTKEVVIRGCQLAPTEGLDICKKVLNHQKDDMEVIHCSLCNTDACNFSPGKNIPWTIALLAIAATLTKY